MIRTTPPGQHMLLYDGHCRLCRAGAKRVAGLAKRARQEALEQLFIIFRTDGEQVLRYSRSYALAR